MQGPEYISGTSELLGTLYATFVTRESLLLRGRLFTTKRSLRLRLLYLSEPLYELPCRLRGLSFGPHLYAGRKGAENQKHAPGRPSGKRKPAAIDPSEHKPSKAKIIPDKEETPSEDEAPAANVEHIDEEEVVEEIIYEEEEARPVAPPRPKVSASARKTGLVESSSDSGHSSGSGSDDDSDDDDDDEDDDDDDGDDDASSGSDDDS